MLRIATAFVVSSAIRSCLALICCPLAIFPLLLPPVQQHCYCLCCCDLLLAPGRTPPFIRCKECHRKLCSAVNGWLFLFWCVNKFLFYLVLLWTDSNMMLLKSRISKLHVLLVNACFNFALFMKVSFWRKMVMEWHGGQSWMTLKWLSYQKNKYFVLLMNGMLLPLCQQIG